MCVLLSAAALPHLCSPCRAMMSSPSSTPRQQSNVCNQLTMSCAAVCVCICTATSLLSPVAIALVVVHQPRGRPPIRWQQCVRNDLQQKNLPHKMDDLRRYCLLRGAWRSRVYRVTHPDAAWFPLQHSCSSSRHRQQSLMRQQRLQQMHPVSNEPVMFAGVGWVCPCGRIHPTRECTDQVVQLGLD
jgi:hypothetical protein